MDLNKAPKPLAQMIITFQADGQIGVAGPTHDRILCMGMLELAKHAILSAPLESAKVIPIKMH